MANPINATIEYVRSSIAELKKVTWPTKDMTIRYTAMVIAVSISLAAFFAVLDFGFSKLMTTVLAQSTANTTQTPAAEQPVVPDVQPTSVETVPVDQSNQNDLKLDLNASSTK